jgi:CubicO group peptidase (beta-lactamase class C family)
MNVHAPSLNFGPLVKPEDVGFSSDRLARIRPALELEIAEKRIPGAVVMIARRGVLAHVDAIGALDPATGDPMPADAIFSIASMTKLMTSQSAPPRRI